VTLLLGVDIGTTATKAILLDPSEGVVGEASCSTTIHSPRPGWAEEDPMEWWENIGAAVRQLLRHGSRELAAVGVSGMVPCVVLLDERGNPLRRSIQQNDARAAEEIAELQSRLSAARLLERTGSALTQQSVGPKLLWLQRWEPGVWSRVHTILGSYDAMVALLTGERSVERNWALESGLFNLEVEDWATDVLEAVGVDRSKLPAVRRPEAVVGAVTASAAEATGIPAGTPVVAGTADHVGSAFSAGVVEDRDVLIKLGGAGDILVATRHPIIDPRLYLDYHLVPDAFLTNGCMATSGTFIRWFQETCAPGTSLTALEGEAAKSPPGAGGVVALPYLLGEKTPINDPGARGVFSGFTLATTRGDLFRAVLEATAYGFRHHLDVLAELGVVPRRLRVTNGGARSLLWRQIVADVVEYPLEVLRTQLGSAFAAAFTAGMGVGTFRAWEDVEAYVEVAETIEPRPDERYADAYRRYRAMYPALRGLWA
jgi:xylulokinase